MVNTISLWSGGHVFDNRLLLNYFEMKYDEQHYIWAYTWKNIFLTIASGATPVGSIERAPDDISWQMIEHEKWRSVTPIGSEFYGCLNPNIFSQNLTVTWDSRVTLSQRNSNAMIYHEGKTPGSVLCGLVYAHGCALLVCIRVYDAKKILVDALGTLRITGIHSL
jgi:hypothetical protein